LSRALARRIPVVPMLTGHVVVEAPPVVAAPAMVRARLRWMHEEGTDAIGRWCAFKVG
jgi:hypothetical protein